MGDYIPIDANERWHFQRNDGGADITLQRKAGTSWLSIDWYRREFDGGTIHPQHYLNFRRRFANEPAYRAQFKIGESKVSEQQNGTNGHAATNAATFTEAPASATVKIGSPNGFDWMLTVRDGTVSGMMDKVKFLEKYLTDHNWQPAQGRSGSPQSNGTSAPTCEYHGPMKASTKAPGTWYCSAKMGNGEYCQSKG